MYIWVYNMPPVKKDKCGDCSKNVLTSEKAVMCDVCQKWYHTKCQDVQDNTYNFLTDNTDPNIHWYCTKCNEGIAECIQSITKLNIEVKELSKDFHLLQDDYTKFKHETIEEQGKNVDKVDSLTKYVTDCKNDIKALKQELQGCNKLKEEMKDVQDKISKNSHLMDEKLSSIKNELPATWSTIVTKEVSEKFKSVDTDVQLIQKLVTENKQKIDDAKDKESRENNIIIYRLKEGNQSTEDQRKQDKDFVMSLIKDALGIDIVETDIKAMYRIGKTNDDPDVYRPFLVQFREKRMKNLVMESLVKLKNAPEAFQNLSIAHDMTKAEREECKRLVEEAKTKQKSETGEFKWLVRGPPHSLKLVRVRTH